MQMQGLDLAVLPRAPNDHAAATIRRRRDRLDSVKGEPAAVGQAFEALMSGLAPFDLRLGPEMVRS
jgi:hypothetical protein